MVTYNKLPFLKRSIEAVLNSLDSEKLYEFIIFDNASDDGTAEWLSLLSHVCPENVKLEIVTGDQNYGLNAYGMIVPKTTAEIVVTVDDDIFDIAPPMWEELFERVLFNKFNGRQFGYVSTDTMNADGGRYNGSPIGYANLGELTVEIGPAGGWFAATTQDVIEDVGGFHTGKGAMHLEDLDFQTRVWNKGFLVGTLMNISVLHARSPRYYKELGREDTYIEKMRLASLEGITLEPIA